MLNIVLADDHEVFREGLTKLFDFDSEVNVVDSVCDGDSLIETLTATQADIAVADVSMPGPGIQGICRKIEELGLKTKVLVLTMHEDAVLANELLGNGASGFVLKRSAFREIKDAMFAIQKGERYASPMVASKMIGASKTKTLTPRELEVVLLIADGLTNSAISKELNISIRTVQTHRERAMDKLDVRSGIELVRRLMETGLLR